MVTQKERREAAFQYGLGATFGVAFGSGCLFLAQELFQLGMSAVIYCWGLL